MSLKIEKKRRILWAIVVNRLIGVLCIYVIGSLLFSSIGDSGEYSRGLWSGNLWETLTFSTQFIHFISYISGGGWTSQAVFTIFSIIGIWYPLKRVQETRDFKLVIYSLYLPTILMWTSPIGKEVITVLSLGILLGCWCDYMSDKNFSVILFLFALYLLILFKPQYCIPIAGSIIVYKTPLAGLRRVPTLGLLIITAIAVGLILYFWGELNQLFLSFGMYFDPSARMTRGTIWINEGDFLTKMPIGIWLSVFGFSPFELIKSFNFLNLFSFLESLFTCMIVARLMRFRRWEGLVKPYVVSLVIILLFLVVHYPYGSLNPGSAARYRSGFLPFIITFLYSFPVLIAKSRSLKMKHIVTNIV